MYTVFTNSDENVVGVQVYIVLSKGLDNVCQGTLLRRLKSLGVRGTALKWLQSNLNDRIQYVKITANNNNVSDRIN